MVRHSLRRICSLQEGGRSLSIYGGNHVTALTADRLSPV
jgi:hypothetical protein